MNIHLITKERRGLNGGFTLVEMIVVIFIMVLITSGFYISYSRFNNNVVLTNIVYDISATIRQTQSFGLSSKSWEQNFLATEASPLAGFDAGYGIRFASDQNKKFALFYDKVEDGVSNWRCGLNADSFTTVNGCGDSAESGSLYQIVGQDSISKFCAVKSDGTKDCYDFSTSAGIKYLDIIFHRADPDSATGPSPDAYFSTDIDVYPNDYQSAEITVKTPAGFARTIYVTTIGQIYVQ